MVRYAGVYAKGMHEPVFIELRLLGYNVIEHYQEHNVVVFTSLHLEQDSHPLPLCFLHQFQLVGSYGVKGKHFNPIVESSKNVEKSGRKRSNNFKKKHRIRDENAIAEASTILKNHVNEFCEEYFKHLYKPWKIVCERQGDHAFSGEDICRLFGSVAHDHFKEAREKGVEMANVSLKHNEVAIFIFVSHVDKTNTSEVSEGDNEVAENYEQPIDLWFFGIRNKISIHSQECINEQKDLPSTTNDSVAACMIILTIEKYCQDQSLLFLDPMCGVGTIPSIFSRISSNLGRYAFAIGSELDESSVKISTQNTGCDQNIVLANTLKLPFPSELFDLIIVDPPWGHRHGKNHVIMKNMFRWMKEWTRVLKNGGILGIVTIRTKQLLHEYESHFNDGRGLELIESVYFENSGMSQCCYFVFRKAQKL